VSEISKEARDAAYDVFGILDAHSFTHSYLFDKAEQRVQSAIDQATATLNAENERLAQEVRKGNSNILAADQENDRLRSALAERGKEVAELKEDEGAGGHYREQLRIGLRHLADARTRIAELEKLCGEAADYLQKVIGWTRDMNARENDLFDRLKLAQNYSAQPGSEKEGKNP
jgi:chromosome segregation ATPase